jgi:aminopeptidase N
MADQFYATEIPGDHGEAFPGLIHLSASTFDETGTHGYDEVFRAHEVAHQWWGIGVDFASYRDQWLSEGFATYAALWYLQVVRGDVKQYFAILDQWKADLLVRGPGAAPIALGYRVADGDYPDDYNLIVYEKGAWVLHMLRALMIDLKTLNDDRFSATMKDFYQTYRGKQASTEDFRRMVETHTGQDMGWFFSEWVDHSAIPTYRVSYQIVDAPGGGYLVRLRVRQEGVPDGFLMYVPVSVELGNDQWVRVRKKVTGAVTEMEVGPLPSKPKSVKFNDLDGVLADVKMVGWSD